MAGLFKKLKDYSFKPQDSKKFQGIADWKQVGEDVRNAGFGALDYASFMFMPALPMLTGKTGTDLLESAGMKTYKGDTGAKMAGISDRAAKVASGLTPLATGAIGQSYGLPFQAGAAVGGLATSAGNAATQGMSGASQRLADEQQQKYTQDKSMYGLYKYKQGGLNSKTVINVEKGELLVNPKTGEIVEHYNDVPKHPKGKHEIDLRGNVEAPVGYAVIPANMASDYKSATPEKRLEMIKTLPGFSNGKLDNGINELGNPIDLGLGAFGTNQGFEGYNPAAQYQPFLATQQTDPVNGIQRGLANMSIQPSSKQPVTSGYNIDPVVGATAVGTAIPLGFGAYQTIASNRGLKQLAKEPWQMYNEETPQELNTALQGAEQRASQAQQRAGYGLSEAQKAYQNQLLSRDMYSRMQRSQDLAGGNLSQAVGGVMNANKIGAIQQMAQQDAALQLQKQQYADRMAQYVDGLLGRISQLRTTQQNQNTAFQQKLKLMKEQAYGLAKQRGLQNMMNAPQQAAATLATYYGGKI
jgi:hypothetical protein